MDRTEQVIMSRIRIGHCKLNNTLKIMGKHPTGQCSCGERETVEHVIVACPRYGREKERMKIELQKTGIRECNFKNIVESAKSKEGRKIIIGFLVSTGIIKRI